MKKRGLVTLYTYAHKLPILSLHRLSAVSLFGLTISMGGLRTHPNMVCRSLVFMIQAQVLALRVERKSRSYVSCAFLLTAARLANSLFGGEKMSGSGKSSVTHIQLSFVIC